MNGQSFDSLTQHAARGISRRASLLTLGTAGFTAIAAPVAAVAKK